MRVVMIAAEAAPFAKAGGLADVVGALPAELEALGFDVHIVMPRYRTIDTRGQSVEHFEPAGDLPFDVGRLWLPKGKTPVYLIGNDYYFGRDGIYADPATGHDYPDQAQRWIYFQRSALEFVRTCLPGTDILHCHDHQTALLPAYIPRHYGHDPRLNGTGTVFTIHNMGYQGIFPADTMGPAGFDPNELYPLGPFEFFGNMNFMKAGLVLADSVTTVSETYAREIQSGPEFGCGLEGVLTARYEPPIGILNGIDLDAWNPATDPLIPARYGLDDFAGKQANKRSLLQEYGLHGSEDAPLFAMISRVDPQKGFDLVAEVLDSLLSRGAQFVMLGQGNKDMERRLASIAERHPGRAGLRFGYSNELAHRIEAGADIFLMPSKYEPCGLNQMYSMRYGTVPIVRSTGGLADTVREFDQASGVGTGFRFDQYAPWALMQAVERALHFWPDKGAWHWLMQNGMRSDFSWSRSAQRYAEVYESVRRRRYR